MCLIIYKPAGKEIPPEQVDTALANNPDGFGMMWIEKGIARSWKIYSTKAKSEILKRVAALTPYEAGVHFRLRTHGEISTDQSHPHEVLNQKEHTRTVWLMHNGIFSTAPITNKAKSDTWHFIEFHLKPLLAYHKDLLETKPEILNDLVGSNKLLLLDANYHKFILVNSNLWHEEDGLKYSNHYSHRKATVWYTPHGNYHYQRTTPNIYSHTPIGDEPTIITPNITTPLISEVKGSFHWEFGSPWQHTPEVLEAMITNDWARFGRWLNTIWRIAKTYPGRPHYVNHMERLQPIIEKAFSKVSKDSPSLPQVFALSWASILDLYPYNLGLPHIFALKPSAEFPGPWREERNHNLKDVGPIWLTKNDDIVALFVKGTPFRRMLHLINNTLLTATKYSKPSKVLVPPIPNTLRITTQTDEVVPEPNNLTP